MTFAYLAVDIGLILPTLKYIYWPYKWLCLPLFHIADLKPWIDLGPTLLTLDFACWHLVTLVILRTIVQSCDVLTKNIVISHFPKPGVSAHQWRAVAAWQCCCECFRPFGSAAIYLEVPSYIWQYCHLLGDSVIYLAGQPFIRQCCQLSGNVVSYLTVILAIWPCCHLSGSPSDFHKGQPPTTMVVLFVRDPENKYLIKTFCI